MTELLFLKFNLASPLATDANVRMSEPDESSRNYHVQVEIVSKHDSWPPPAISGSLGAHGHGLLLTQISFVFALSRGKFTYWVLPIKLMDFLNLCSELNWDFILIFTFACCSPIIDCFNSGGLFTLNVRPFQSYLTRGDGWKSLFRFNEGKLLNSVKCGPKLGCSNMICRELNCSI